MSHDDLIEMETRNLKASALRLSELHRGFAKVSNPNTELGIECRCEAVRMAVIAGDDALACEIKEDILSLDGKVNPSLVAKLSAIYENPRVFRNHDLVR